MSAWHAGRDTGRRTDKVLLNKFKKLTGGRLRAAIAGGGAISSEVEELLISTVPILNRHRTNATSPKCTGAISSEVQEWCRTALDCPLVQATCMYY